MSIHQLSLAFQADQDRLLLRVRTRDEQLYDLWLTRRIMVRLWQPLQVTATNASLGTVSRGATVLPEARDMMTQSLRNKAIDEADFQSPFDESAKQRPLGEHPMLVAAVDLKLKENCHVELVLRDAHQRKLSLSLTPNLLSNLLTLLERALAQSEWGLVPTGAPNNSTPGELAPASRILN